MISDTISVVELVAQLLVLSGLGLTGWSLSLVLGDAAQVRKQPNFVFNSPKHRLAKRNVRTEAGKAITLFFYAAAIGILMFIPPRADNPYNVGSLAATFAILWSLFVMVIDTALYIRDRTVIVDILISSANQRSDPSLSTLVRNADGPDTLVVPVNVVEESD